MAFCSACGSQLPDGARFCPGCGAATAGTAGGAAGGEPRPPFAAPPAGAPVTRSGGTGWVLPVLVLVALVAIAYLTLRPRSDTAAVETAQPATGAAPTLADRVAGTPPTTSAAVLDSAFSSDPAGAAARYAGPVRVSGVIASMVQPGATPSLSMEGRTRFNFMIVNFPAGYRERLAPLSKGQVITVACAGGARSLGGTTILGDCTLD